MPAWPLAPAAVILTLGYVTYRLWQSNAWQVTIAIGALALGNLYYHASLHTTSHPRSTMPEPARGQHAVEDL